MHSTYLKRLATFVDFLVVPNFYLLMTKEKHIFIYIYPSIKVTTSHFSAQRFFLILLMV